MIQIFTTPVIELSKNMQEIVFAVRIFLALVCSGLLGYERAVRFKEAGIRTHCLVGIASCSIMILSKYGFQDMGIGFDPGRIAAQVVSGVGFLGTAIVFKQGSSIRGVTTAAGIWATASIGMLFGAGMYILGFIVTFIIIIVLVVLHKLNLANDAFTLTEISIIMDNDEKTKNLVMEKINEHDCVIMHTHMSYLGNGQIGFNLVVRNKINFEFEEIQAFLKKHPSIHSFSI